MSYLHKWLILGALIGVVAGIGAIVFTTALELATKFFLGVLAGYTPPSPIGEGNAAGSASFARPWAIPLVVAVGGLLSGALVFGLAPEAEGHGTDAAIDAVHRNPRGIRARVSVVKIIASAITIGSGGSGGREGPTAQISAGFGSLLARVLDLSPEDARIAVTVGTGAGIGAIFRAPLGGAVLGAEILYRDDVEVQALVPSLVASVVGFSIFGTVKGFTPIFGFLRGYRFTHPIELLYFALIGLLAGLVGRLYATSFYGVARNRKRFPGPDMLKPAIAGLMVGLLALALPGVLGTGYGWVQRAMGPTLLSIPLWIVLLLPLAKIAATSLSIGSGGSGGIFGPGMVIGGFLGAGVWRLLAPIAPGIPHDPSAFVVVGMTACFGSVAHAPLALLLMVAEMTGSLELLAPAMIAIGLASVTVGDVSIYASQLRSRVEAAAHRFRYGLPLMAGIPVGNAVKPARLVLVADTTAHDASDRLRSAAVPGAPVVDGDGRFLGSIEASRIDEDHGDLEIAANIDRQASVVADDTTLDAVVEALAVSGTSWLTVLDRRKRVVGIVSVSDVVEAYRDALESNVRLLAGAFTATAMIEADVGRGSVADGQLIGVVHWPSGSMIVAVQRGDHLLVPSAATVLLEGDGVIALAPAGAEDELRVVLGSEPRSEVDDAPAGPELI